MKDFLKNLFEYNDYCNKEILKVLLANPDKVSEKSLKLVSHILNAHHIWNRRIEFVTPSFKVWDLNPTEQLTAIHAENVNDTALILEKNDLSAIIDYVNSYGGSFKNNTGDILYHVINHSNYHRAQINTELKEKGIAPVVTDYIFYKR